MKPVKAMLVFASSFVLCVALAGCGSSGASSSASSSAAPDAASSAASTSVSASAPASSAGQGAPAASTSAVTVTADELAAPDVVVDFDDYDSMTDLSKKIQNGEMDGQVVEIDGYVSHFGTGMAFNIVEKNSDDSASIGTEFVIDGVEGEDAYPADETHVKVTGKVGLDESSTYYLIHTLPEFVEAL